MFEAAYLKQEVHPMDVKAAVSGYLIEMLAPAREYFDKHPDILEEVEKTFK
jgi:hypothetical protein